MGAIIPGPYPARDRRGDLDRLSGGRGLRRALGKAVLTVLDFIGQHRREFRFDVRYRKLTGTGRRTLERHIKQGFPFLPSGSKIVLDNVRMQLRLARRDLVADVRSHGDVGLARYLGEVGRDLADVYRGGGSWTGRSRARNRDRPGGPGSYAGRGRSPGRCRRRGRAHGSGRRG